MEDPWGSRNPFAGLRGGVGVVVGADVEKCIKDGVEFWTSPSGAILTREDSMPRCMLSVTSMEGFQLSTNISGNTC